MSSMRGDECIIQVNEQIKGGEASSEVAPPPDWISRMEDELKELKQNRSKKLERWKEASIYMIPLSLKALCEEAYQPQMVAIGPYHHDDEQLKGMEEHKMRALLNFLERSGKTFKFYVTALAPSLQEFKNAYRELQTDDDGNFLKMMIVDGCFMLELMRSYTNYTASTYEVEDPIFSDHGHLYFSPYLKRDMLMLENQIPLLVLVKLVDAEGLQTELTSCILKFFNRKDRIGRIQDLEKCPHLLYLYRKSLLCYSEEEEEEEKKKKKKEKEKCCDGIGKLINQIKQKQETQITNKKKQEEEKEEEKEKEEEEEKKKEKCCDGIGKLINRIKQKRKETQITNKKKQEEEKEKEEEKERQYNMKSETQTPASSCYRLLGSCRKKEKEKQDSMRSATELSKAWIRLKTSETTCLDDIKFSGRDLKLPRIKVDDATKHLYLNLMALERLQVDAGNEVTSYVYFMDKLIDSAEDVNLLHWRGIMENMLGSDQEAAELFNKLSTDICLDNQSVFFSVQENVAKYYRMPLLRCIAYAEHTYCTNPWVVLSVVAAIFLFALTIVQTVYAILDYRKI